MSFRVATYNILDPIYAVGFKQKEGLTPQGGDNWQSRKVELLQNITALAADVLCLQEVSDKSLKDLKSGLVALGYEVSHVRHNDPQKKDGTAICFKKNRFNFKISCGRDFSFERVGRPPGSKSTLTHGYVNLYDTSTQKTICVATCHLAGGGNGMAPGNKHIDAVLKTLDENLGQPKPDTTILTGDFNADQHHERYVTMSQNYMHDGNLSPTEPGKNRKIDWIWAKKLSNQILLQSVSPAVPYPEASDHLPVATDFSFPQVVPVAPVPIVPVGPLPALPVGSFRHRVFTNFKVPAQFASDEKTILEYLQRSLDEANTKHLQRAGSSFETLTRLSFIIEGSKKLGYDFEKQGELFEALKNAWDLSEKQVETLEAQKAAQNAAKK